jgi:Protein of unknown function (DUF3500)
MTFYKPWSSAKTILIVLPILAVALTASGARSISSIPDNSPSGTSQVVRAARAFLATLSEQQRAAVIYKFDDNAQRMRWSNFPTGVVQRGGLRLQDLSETQRSAALALLSSALSDKGFEKVEEIRDADDAFKATPHPHPPFGNGKRSGGHPQFGNDGPAGPGHPPFNNLRSHGPRPEMFGKNLYYISFLGIPSEKYPWMLQFGGHHLALNITIVGEQGVLTPSLTGTQPATFQLHGKIVRPLGHENDKAFALLNSLGQDQRKQAILNYRVEDLVLGPGHDGERIEPEGLKASAMNEKQRAMLLDLISEWARIVNDSFASPRMAEIKSDIDETWFAWSGPTTADAGKNGTSYYRIQGPKLVIEYAPQHSDDHIHTIYRDPTNDYGVALSKE